MRTWLSSCAAGYAACSSMRVLLADDHVLVRRGIRALLENLLPDIEIVGEADDGREALRMLTEQTPDIAFIDISMPGISGIEVAERAAHSAPATHIVILSMHDTEAHVVRALRARVRGYLLKHAAAEELAVAVHTVMDGRRYLSPSIAKYALLERRRAATPWPIDAEIESLSPRQREVLRLLAKGQSVKEIAYALSLSVKTVETHRAQLMARLQIRDVPTLVRFAIRCGLIGVED
jgi:DNA-binding NarL/FixJ family response regulator